MKHFSWMAAVAVAAALTGCSFSEPTWLKLGTTQAQALEQLGAPTAVYPLPDGGQRLQYSRLPMGFEVSNVDVDASGRVVSVRQELSERLFPGTIQPGVWRVEDMLRTYGRPYEITRVYSFDGVIWTWRYKEMNEQRLLHIYVRPDGVVDRYQTIDDFRVRNSRD
jgi:hypothetical protein